MMVATLQRLRRVSDLRSDPDPSADSDYREIQGVQGSGGRAPSELEAPCKEEKKKGEQLGCETKRTSSPPPAVTGDRESPTTAREIRTYGGARVRGSKRGETLERNFSHLSLVT
ncbi:hypothetical protein IGI04_038083 [Brassica rapa subsp. trilocularis]|uniref:Uncharacterized protein n=1 Tax=Brassica rapa subsp. trilocularis TaxID=1813537 RepID=A0ABQ7LJ76_BRACM|nr:hypothetical protein IGI04_038083 [Brassica rapa subsp. trilocularis]